MENQTEHITMLDLMLRPAFLVRDGVIIHVNSYAAPFLLCPGTPALSLILHGQEEYMQFTQGQLYLTLQLGSQAVDATVVDTPYGHMFLPEQSQSLPQQQALALAASQLRQPLNGIFSTTEQIFSQLQDPQLRDMAAQTNRRLLQLQRMVGNMSDALLYAQSDPQALETVRVDTFLSELLHKAAEVIAKAGRQLQLQLCEEAIYTLADRQKLERAVLNMLSNALKFTPEDRCVTVQVRQSNQRIYISVIDGGDESADAGLPSAVNRFLREPALEDPRWGIGLGLLLMRSVAATHHGAVLMDKTAQGSNRVTLTLAVRQIKQSVVRSPILSVDYAGERDHLLLELSDVLPWQLYAPDALN